MAMRVGEGLPEEIVYESGEGVSDGQALDENRFPIDCKNNTFDVAVLLPEPEGKCECVIL